MLDSGNPNLIVKELEGTGRTHNWSLSKRIREKVKIPVFLAGGLNPDNLTIAFNTVKPFALDLSSGIKKAKGVKDAQKIYQLKKIINDLN